MGIEPTSSAWKAEVLPLNYTRLSLAFVGLSAHFFTAIEQAHTKSVQSVFFGVKNSDSQLNRPNFKIYQYVFGLKDKLPRSLYSFRPCHKFSLRHSGHSIGH